MEENILYIYIWPQICDSRQKWDGFSVDLLKNAE